MTTKQKSIKHDFNVNNNAKSAKSQCPGGA